MHSNRVVMENMQTEDGRTRVPKLVSISQEDSSDVIGPLFVVLNADQSRSPS